MFSAHSGPGHEFAYGVCGMTLRELGERFCQPGIRYTRNLERNGGDARVAWERLVAFYRHEWPDQEDVEDDLALLLEEADRIDTPDPFQTVIKEG